MDYLSSIEKEKLPAIEDQLESKKHEIWSKFYPYKETYLEFVVSTGEGTDKYQTILAELYIENLFKIQDRLYKDIILHATLIEPRRKKLK